MMGKLNLVNSPRTNETLELNVKLETSHIYIYIHNKKICVRMSIIYIYINEYITYNIYIYICLIVDLSLFFSSGCDYIWLYLVI